MYFCKMKIFILFLLSIISLTTAAQTKNGNIRGVVKDSAGKGFEQATVVLFRLQDSSVAETVSTNDKGEFLFKNLALDSFRIFISSIEFNAIIRDVTLTTTVPSKNLGTLLGKKTIKGNEITVVAQNPIRITTDTVEFRADAFKTRPNAMVEDLLKRLPGVQVDKDGKVTAGGQTVTKVFVDGKQFFGDDPKTATKNLPAGVVDKVQVIDRKSDQSQFTGFDDGTTEKVINITIKKDKKKGYFGRASVAAGTSGRYENNLSFNRFNNGMQLSVIAQANNTNNEGFTFQDIMDFSGNGGMRGGGDGGGGGGMTSVTSTRGGGGIGPGGQSFGGPPAGIRTTQAAGVNFSNAFSKKLSMTGSYFFNNSYILTERTSSRQQFAKDTSFNIINDQNTINRAYNTNHRVNMEVDWNIDSFNSVLFRPNLTVVQKSSNTTSTTAITNMVKALKSSISQTNSSANNQLNVTGSILWRHKTRVKGRTLSVRVNGGDSRNEGDNTNFNQQNRVAPFPITTLIDQEGNSLTDGNTLNTRVSYTEPLSKRKILELYHVYSLTANNTERLTYNIDGFGFYTRLDTTLSNTFENRNSANQLGFNIQTKFKKYDYAYGLALQNANLTSVNILKNISIQQKNVVNLFPNARFNYNLGKSRNLRINYRGNTNQPSVTQLQPVLDNSNPLSLRQGNPALKQEFTNNFNFNYSKFDFISMKRFFTFFNFSNTANKIVDSVQNIGAGAQFRRPGNAKGAYNIVGNVTYGFPIKKAKLDVNFITSVIHLNDVSVIDAKNNTTKNTIATETISINHNYKDKLDIMLSLAGVLNNSTYTLTPNQNNRFYNYNASFDISYNFRNSLTIQTDIENNTFTGRSAAFNTSFNMWNASITKLLLKDKSLELRFTAFDILRQNQSITRTVQETFIDDTRNNIIQQYFLVGVRYNLNKFGAKGNKFTMPKMPGMRGMNNIRIGM